MAELEIKLVDGSETNFDETFLQFNVKKKYELSVMQCGF